MQLPWTATVRSLATQTLLSTDEDERPIKRTVFDNVSESAIDVLDKASAHTIAHANFIHKTSNMVIKAAHGLDGRASSHGCRLGERGCHIWHHTISMSLARPNDEGLQGGGGGGGCLYSWCEHK